VDSRAARCDLHVHSIHSTDTGNFALRRAKLGESYTKPARGSTTCAVAGWWRVDARLVGSRSAPSSRRSA